MARVAVLMSGGIDSAGAALLLKRQGHEVEGVTAEFREGTGGETAGAAARETCRALGVRHRVVDMRSEFRRDVLGPFVSGYLAGRTPNPCACCNRDVKLGALAAKVKNLGFDFVATGHYGRVGEVGGRPTLCEPADRRKSQVYFLALVKPEVLDFLLLPLRDYKKEEVGGLLRQAGIPAAAGNSQDLCFAAGRGYRDILRMEGYTPAPGDVLDTDGNVVARHKGHALYTPGQRFGLRGRRYYVIRKDPDTNIIVIGKRDEASTFEIAASGINLFLPLPAVSSGGLTIRYRYNSARLAARIAGFRGGRIKVVTEEACFAPAPGQILAGYSGDCLVFGGVIE